ncbi:MAG TPA: DUF308 domain-containing protein [Candidatus Nitrosopolaris sp.]|nr:DUF308 domain-containing protein [Candidatus Nitrosopolaris sp.]
MRAVQIGLGVIAIILSILVIVHPGITLFSIIYILGITLVVLGIFEIITGIFGLGANKSRWGTVGLGVLSLIFGSIAVGYPVHTAVFVVILLAIALLFIGISRIIRGVVDKQSRGWARGFSIGAGVIAIALFGLIMASPLYGAIFVSILVSLILGIALLILGIEIIASGISGRKMQIP